jgi:hypothetical protein
MDNSKKYFVGHRLVFLLLAVSILNTGFLGKMCGKRTSTGSKNGGSTAPGRTSLTASSVSSNGDSSSGTTEVIQINSVSLSTESDCSDATEVLGNIDSVEVSGSTDLASFQVGAGHYRCAIIESDRSCSTLDVVLDLDMEFDESTVLALSSTPEESCNMNYSITE